MTKRGRDKFNKYKKVILFCVNILKLFPHKFLQKRLIKARFIESNFGLVYRYILVKILAKDCGDNVFIAPQVYLLNINNISFGNNVSIHTMCYLDGFGGIKIGNDVSIAEKSSLISFEHNYTNLDIPIKDQGVTGKEINICDNVWIGSNSKILSGVTINSGSIVGAGAVVTKDISNNVIVGGCPAIIIKERK